MKVPIYTIYIITLLIIGPSTVAAGSVIDLEDEEKSSERLQFGTETNNLTQNQNDSVYPQTAASKNNVYVVWSESTQSSTDNNYDIYFKASSDGGKTFGRTINLSDNPSFSEHPQIAAVENNVYESGRIIHPTQRGLIQNEY
jgi:hypothetical protein